MRKNYFSSKAVILAGGKGSRLYPLTKKIPKPLLPVKQKPIINYLVDLFFNQGVKEIAVLINKDFEEHFKRWKEKYYPKANIRFTVEESPLGTFGGLYFLKKWIGEDNFFVSNGDELKEINIREMYKKHQRKFDTIGTLALLEVEDPTSYGTVVYENGMIKDFREKSENPPSKFINSGLYLFSPAIFNYHPGPQFLMVEKDIFPLLAKEGKLGGFKFEGKWMDCGTWERYKNALKNWKEL